MKCYLNKQVKNSEIRAGESGDQWEKCLPCKLEGLSSNPQKPHKPRHGSMPCNPSIPKVRW